MVAGTCPHCNQRLGFSSPKPGIYECPFCSNKFKIGTTNSKSTPKNTKPKKPIKQVERSLGESIALGLSMSIGSVCMIICIGILFSDDGMLFFSIFPFFLGSYLLVYSYKITSKSGGGKGATGNQTATILVEGQEYNVKLQSNKNATEVDGVLKVLKYGVIVSLVLTIIGLVVMAILAYIFFMMILSLIGVGW